MREKLVVCALLMSCMEPPTLPELPVAASSDGSEGSSSTGAHESSSGGLPQGTGCCAAHDGPGCDEAAVQSCVCAASAACCTFDWDELCVEAATNDCAASCMPDPAESSSDGGESTDDTGGGIDTGAGDTTTGGAPPPPNEGPCCEINDTAVGCADPLVSACACDLDPFCCTVGWDEICLAEATMYCGLVCR